MAEVSWMWFGRQPQINTDYRTSVSEAEADKIEGYSATGPSEMQAVTLDGSLRSIQTNEGNTQAFATTYNNHKKGYSVFDYTSPATGTAQKAAITGFMPVRYELILPDGTPWQGDGVLIQMNNGDIFFRPAKTEIKEWEQVPEIKSVKILEASSLPSQIHVAPVSFSRDIFEVQVVCFCAGTLIATPSGETRIEDLSEGDLVMTQDHGPRPVRWHGKRSVSSSEMMDNPKLRPICISAGSLGEGRPALDLMVSRQHRILVRSAIAQRMFGTMEILVPAIQLTSVPGIAEVQACDPVTYHHLLLDRHEVIFANGAASESLFLGPHATDAMGTAAAAEIKVLWPDSPADVQGPQARPFQRGQKVTRMLSRHVVNNRPLTSGS